MAKKKHPKMDKNWVSLQPHELKYIAAKFGVSEGVVRQAKKSVGKSRQKVYAYIGGHLRSAEGFAIRFKP